MNLRIAGIALVGLVSLVGGCAYPERYPVYDARPVITHRTEYGVVESIQMYRDGSRSPVNVGTLLGGIAGGVIGHQIGSGRGNTAATIAGAVGGAVVGNQIDNSQSRDTYRVVVRLDSGGTLTASDVEGDLRVGDRVRIVNNRIYRS